MGKLTIEFDILGMTKPQRGNADLGCYLGDVVAVALYYLGEVRKENAGSDSQASAPPPWSSTATDTDGTTFPMVARTWRLKPSRSR